jgi:ribosome-associated protein
MTSPPEEDALPVVRKVVEILEDRQAEDLLVLDLRGKSSVTDFLVLATGNSTPHLRALCRAAEEALGRKPAKQSLRAEEWESGWVVADGIDVVVHLFSEEMRRRFRLEQLWKDAPMVEVGTSASAREER